MRLTVARSRGQFNRFFIGFRKRQKKPPFSGLRYGHPAGLRPQRLAYTMALRLRLRLPYPIAVSVFASVSAPVFGFRLSLIA